MVCSTLSPTDVLRLSGSKLNAGVLRRSCEAACTLAMIACICVINYVYLLVRSARVLLSRTTCGLKQVVLACLAALSAWSLPSASWRSSGKRRRNAWSSMAWPLVLAKITVLGPLCKSCLCMICHRSPLVHRLKCFPNGLCCKVSLAASGNREEKEMMFRLSQFCIFQALFKVAAESMASRHESGENKTRTSPSSSALVDDGS